MNRARIALAIAAGLLLATLPFLRYARFPGEAHADHAPRHGGQLGMVGDHHVEVARRRGQLEAFVSDAWRRPLRPRRAWVTFDGAAPVPLSWESYRLVGPDVPPARVVDATILLDDGTRLAISFDFGG